MSIFGLEMPVASAATSASRTAISARPNRLRATLALNQGARAVIAHHSARSLTPCRTAPGIPDGDADTAAGDALPRQRDLRHDGGENQRRHREIEVRMQRRQADDHAEYCTDHAAIGNAANTRTGGMTLPATSTLVV